MGWVRIAKLVALLGFFLPWVTVSCEGHPSMEASGWTLATGHYRLLDADSGALRTTAEPGNAVLLAVLFLIVIGFALTFVRRRGPAVLVAAAALAALAACWHGTRDLRPERLAREAARHGMPAQHVPDAIRIDWRVGWWLTNGGLLAAAALAGLAASGRSLRIARR